MPKANSLRLNYQKLDVLEDFVTLGWTFGTGDIHDTVFTLQGFNLSAGVSNSTAPSTVLTFWETDIGVIPSDQLTTSAGDPVLFRLLAQGRRGATHYIPKTFFRFDGEFP